MQRRKTMTAFCAAVFTTSIGVFWSPVKAADEEHNNHFSVWSTFGRGLNTAQPGNPVNHVIFPKEIKVKVGGVVNFAVAGFHDIVIFKPGFKREDLDPYIPASGTFIFPREPATPLPPQFAPIAGEVYYRGINPAGGPPPAPAAGGDPNNASNRMETVAFLEKGTYLVICNVRPHLNDGMYAYVKVTGDD